MKDIKTRILLYGCGISALVGLGSLPVIGLEWSFLAGLLAGTAISALCVLIMIIFTELVLSRGNRLLSFAGLFLRIMLYGFSFYIVAKNLGLTAAIGTAIGFFTMYVSLLGLIAVGPMIARRRKKDAPPQIYIYEKSHVSPTGRREYAFIKKYSMTRESGNRRYVTHKRFRKLKEIKG